MYKFIIEGITVTGEIISQDQDGLLTIKTNDPSFGPIITGVHASQLAKPIRHGTFFNGFKGEMVNERQNSISHGTNIS